MVVQGKVSHSSFAVVVVVVTRSFTITNFVPHLFIYEIVLEITRPY